jgi:hypothetical protein
VREQSPQVPLGRESVAASTNCRTNKLPAELIARLMAGFVASVIVYDQMEREPVRDPGRQSSQRTGGTPQLMAMNCPLADYNSFSPSSPFTSQEWQGWELIPLELG